MSSPRLAHVVCLLALALAGCPTPNTPPTANAGPDQSVALGDTVQLDGAGSADADGGTLTFQWQFIARPEGSLPVLSGPGTSTPSFTADRPGTYSLRLTIIDSGGASNSDTVAITVSGSLAVVPDVVGLSEAEADAALSTAGLVKGEVASETSVTVPLGRVIRTAPESGTSVLPGSAIVLVLSLGPDRVNVPDVVGLTQSLAESALGNRTLLVGVSTFEHSESVSAGIILSSAPEAGAEVDEGTAVDLVVSLGPESERRVAVPDVAGQTEAEAGTTMAGTGLTVGDITYENNDTVAAGSVIRTDPAADVVVLEGTAIDLVVSAGPVSDIEVDVPDLAGLTETEAVEALGAIGLNLGSVERSPDEDATPDTIIAQEPASGTTVNEGTFVDVTLALAPINVALRSTTDVRASLGDMLDGNLGRPDATAADPVRGEIYIASLITPHIAIYDTALNQISETFETNFVLPGEKRLFLSPGGGALYVFDAATSVLARLDRDTNTETANTPLDTGFQDLAIDTAENRLFVLRSSAPGLLIFNATTLVQEDSTTALAIAGVDVTQDIAYNATTMELWALDTTTDASDGTVHLYDPTSDSIADTISFDMPGSGNSTARQLLIDPVSNRFFVRADRALGVYGTDGGNPRSLPLPSGLLSTDMVYDPVSDQVLAIALEEPEVASVGHRGAFLLTFNPNLGQGTSPQHTIPLGEVNGSLALDNSANLLLCTDSYSGTVWTLSTDPYPDTADFFALGFPIDQIIRSGNQIFGTSRYGNSTLFHFLPGEGAVSTFSAGTWPAPIAVVPATFGSPRLAVVNAWDRTVSVFTAGQNPTIADTLDTGLPTGTTGRLPGIAVSPNGAQIAVAWPEFAKVVVLNIGDGSIEATIDVPNVAAGTLPEGKGQLQVLFDQSGAGVLFVYNRLGAVLHRYDGANAFTPLSTANLGGRLPDMADAPETGWLFHDPDNSVLFVGPARLNPNTGLISGDLLPSSQIVLASDTTFGLYWTLEQHGTSSGFATVIRSVTREGNALGEAEIPLAGTHPITPEFVFDTANRQVHIAFPERAIVESYGY